MCKYLRHMCTANAEDADRQTSTIYGREHCFWPGNSGSNPIEASRGCLAPTLGTMELARVTLLNGEIVEVEGDVGEVEKLLSDAARSGHARFAWLIEHGSG